MNGLLQIIYKNGEIRRVRLDPSFFREHKVSIGTRALDIAHSHNPAPWKIVVHKDEIEKFNKTIDKHAPDPVPKKKTQRTGSANERQYETST